MIAQAINSAFLIVGLLGPLVYARLMGKRPPEEDLGYYPELLP